MKTLVPARVAAGAAVATRAAGVQRALVASGDGACTDRALGERWGMAHHHVAELLDPASGKALTLRDLAASPRSFHEGVLVTELAALYAEGDPSARNSLDRVTVELGAATRALIDDVAADGREDEHARHAAALRKIAAIALRGAASAERRSGGAR